MCRDDSYSTIVSCLNADLRPQKEKNLNFRTVPVTWMHRAVSMSIDRIFGELSLVGRFPRIIGFFL